MIYPTNKVILHHLSELVPVLAVKGELSQGGDVTCNGLSECTNSRVAMKSLHNHRGLGIVVRLQYLDQFIVRLLVHFAAFNQTTQQFVGWSAAHIK